jgi:arylsulfatase A-like enzyme
MTEAAPSSVVAWMAVGAVAVGMTDGLALVLGERLGLGAPGVAGVIAVGATAGLTVASPFLAAALSTRRLRPTTALGAAVWGAVPVLGTWLGVVVHEATSLEGWLAWALGIVTVGGLVGGTLRATQGRAWRDRGLLAGLAVWASLVLVTSWHPTDAGAPASAEHPDVLLVTVSSLRRDRRGDHRTDTPTLDRLAVEGSAMELAVAPSTLASEGMRAVLTGQPPWVPGDGGRTLTEVLAARGYETGAFVGKDELGRHTGLDAGFGVYDDDHEWPKGTDRLLSARLGRMLGMSDEVDQRRAGDVVEHATRFIAGREGTWFAWVHLADPEAPYDPPTPWDERYYGGHDPRDPGLSTLSPTQRVGAHHGAEIRGVTDADYVEARYDGEVSYVDAQLGRLLEAVDPSRTLVVVAGLYGENLQDGPVWFGHEALAPASVDVPVLWWGPGRVPYAARVHAPFELTDIGATLLDFLDVEAELGESRSYRRAIAGEGAGRDLARTRQPSGAVGAIRTYGCFVEVHDEGRVAAARVPDGPDLPTPSVEELGRAVAVAASLCDAEVSPDLGRLRASLIGDETSP